MASTFSIYPRGTTDLLRLPAVLNSFSDLTYLLFSFVLFFYRAHSKKHSYKLQKNSQTSPTRSPPTLQPSLCSLDLLLITSCSSSSPVWQPATYLHVELDREITQPIVPTLCELPKGVLLLENKALVSNDSVMPRYHGGKTANIPVIHRQREGSAQQMEKVLF